ncbi:MAG: hypothetical protein ACR2RE_02200 [Geminicoccaceae bacterium]
MKFVRHEKPRQLEQKGKIQLPAHPSPAQPSTISATTLNVNVFYAYSEHVHHQVVAREANDDDLASCNFDLPIAALILTSASSRRADSQFKFEWNL